MKILGFTCTYNEEGLIPYVMPYVEAFGYDKFIVYDNMSTDRTVELLKEYPFVEIIPWDTKGQFNEDRKCQLQRRSFDFCKGIASVGTSKEELVWMTWTDFDEVLFCNTDGDFRAILEGDYTVRKYNYYCKNMINLLPPKGMEDLSPSEYFQGGRLIHGCPNMRGTVWVGGMKPTMMAVNDFERINPFPGNHYLNVLPRLGKTPKNYDDCCRIYSFHLKFIDKKLLEKKWEGYGVRGSESYLKQAESIDRIYEGQLSLSFPLENYFLADFLDSGLTKKTVSYNGLRVIPNIKMKKKLVFHWFCPNEGMDGNTFSNTNKRSTPDIVKYFTLHEKCLKRYSHIFDEATIVFAKEDKVTDEQIEALKAEIIRLGLKNVTFVVRDNNANGECDTYRDFVVNEDDFDGLVFYYHTKGMTHKFEGSMIDWVLALYFFNLEYIDDIETALKTHVISGIFKVSDHEDGRDYIYSGNAFWFDNKKFHEKINAADPKLLMINNRWWCEGFAGKVVPSNKAHSIGNFLTKWDDYKECLDHIKRCVGEDRTDKFLEFKNEILS